MKLDAGKLFLATVISLAIVWAVCSAFVAFLPGAMMGASGHMVHADFGHLAWTLTWPGFILGGILWSVLGGAITWLVATVYNRLLGANG